MKTIKIQATDIYSSRKEPKNHSPILDYCRKLIANGENEKTRLEVYRWVLVEDPIDSTKKILEERLCLIISEIGKGAKFAITENEKIGPILIKYRPFPEKLKRIAS